MQILTRDVVRETYVSCVVCVRVGSNPQQTHEGKLGPSKNERHEYVPCS